MQADIEPPFAGPAVSVPSTTGALQYVQSSPSTMSVHGWLHAQIRDAPQSSSVRHVLCPRQTFWPAKPTPHPQTPDGPQSSSFVHAS
ncbi:MAG: hypothetical protein KF782_24105 [Labilithrix sp.]|nr:hypothetical protein [Labilithrix sp.]